MKKGFTLVELLVVVLIIGILAAIAVPQYTKSVEKSRVSEALINLKALQNATKMYYESHNFTYPRLFSQIDTGLDPALLKTECSAATPTANVDCYVTNDFYYVMRGANGSVWAFRIGPDGEGTTNSPGSYAIVFHFKDQGGYNKECINTKTTDTFGDDVCKSFNGEYRATNNGWKYYTF